MDIPKGSSLDRALNHDDTNAARELEDEIDRRGLQESYIRALHKNIDPEWDFELFGSALETNRPAAQVPLFLWYLLRAAPEQRARAFIAATQSQ